MTGTLILDTVQVDTIKDESGGNSIAQSVVFSGTAKAWAAIGYSAGTPSVAQSSNVSSLTDTATGFISVNYSSNFNAGNYGAGTAAQPSTNNDAAVNVNRRNVDFLSAQLYENATSATDPNYFGFSADGDLA